MKLSMWLVLLTVTVTGLVAVWVGWRQPTDPRGARYNAHRQRVDTLVRELSGESLEKAAGRLDEKDPYMFPGAKSGLKFAQMDFETMLSNRRVLRLMALLDRLPGDDAAQHSRQGFDRFAQQGAATVDAIIRSYDDPAAPKNHRSMLGDKWAAGTCTFMTARFGHVQDVLLQLESLEAKRPQYAHRLARGAYPESLAPAIDQFAFLDLRFHMNVLAYAVNRDPAIHPDKKRKLERYLQRYPSRLIPIVAWDATNTWFDCEHDPELAVDTRKGTEQVRIYDWPTPPYPGDDGPRQEVQSLSKYIRDEIAQ